MARYHCRSDKQAETDQPSRFFPATTATEQSFLLLNDSMAAFKAQQEDEGYQFPARVMLLALILLGLILLGYTALGVLWGVTVFGPAKALIPTSAIAFVVWLFWRASHVNTIGTVLGLVGIEVLTVCTLLIHSSDSLFDATPIMVMFWSATAWLVASCGCFVFTAWKSTSRRWRNALCAAAAPVVPVLFFTLLFPLAVDLRRSRHIGEMAGKTPYLRAISDYVEASCARLGRIPANEEEFDDLLLEMDDAPGPELGMDYVIRYRKVNPDRYELIFEGIDVEYVYDSGTPNGGWNLKDGDRSPKRF